MEYTIFTINTKAINLASTYSYSPYSDIVWSFDYAISGNQDTEAGFTVFLMQDNKLSGGNNGIDLGYSGASYNLPTLNTIKAGISCGILAAGFDTLGVFAMSASFAQEISGTHIFENVTIRDGVDLSKRISNSVSIRSKFPDYSFNTYSYNKPISDTAVDFKIVESDIFFKTIRARLGNIGKTLYVDYRNNPDDAFKPMLEYDVNLNIDSSTKYKVGVSISTPLTSNDLKAVGNAYLRNFHTEGSFISGGVTSIINTNNVNNIPTVTILPPSKPPSVQPVPDIVNKVLPLRDYNTVDNASIFTTIVGGRLSSLSGSNYAFTQDLYNFGYTIKLYNSLSSVLTVLTRQDTFLYKSQDTKYSIYRDGICNFWTLSGPSSLISTVSSYIPIGVYNNTLTATYV